MSLGNFGGGGGGVFVLDTLLLATLGVWVST